MSQVTVHAGNTNALSLNANSKLKRMTKKEFFATLSPDLGRSEKERAFSAYAEGFSAQRSAELAGALSAGLIRVNRLGLGKSGKTGSVGFEVVQAKEPRQSLKAKLEAQIDEQNEYIERLAAERDAAMRRLLAVADAAGLSDAEKQALGLPTPAATETLATV